MSETIEIEKVIRLVAEMPDLRQKLRQALGIEDDYSKKSDLKPILEELVQLRKDMDRRFDRVDRTLSEMKAGLGINFEGYNKGILSHFLKESKGIPTEDMIWRAMIPDPEGEVNPETKQVEIDIFLQHPLTIVEVTSYEDSLKKIHHFIRTVRWLEKKYKEKATAYYLTYSFSENIYSEARKLLHDAGVVIVITAT